jgi:flagellar hook-length control protein FliK
MNAPGLPIPTSATPATPSPVESALSAAPAGAPAPTDFMLALAQMLGANLPAATGQTSAATAAELSEEADTDASDEAAALALLPLPISQVQPPVAQTPAQSDAFDPIEALGLNPRPDGANARDAALLQAMAERLAAVTEASEPVEAAGSPTYLPSVDPQQPVRTTGDGAITRPVHVPVGTPGWADEIGSRLTLMTHKGEHTASLRLSPEHLGPLEIRIAMRDDQASVWFGAAHADTRAAIEHALPRLREMFSAQGMSLADAGVFREPPRQQMPAFANNAQAGGEGASEAVTAPVHVKVGLLDAYA